MRLRLATSGGAEPGPSLVSGGAEVRLTTEALITEKPEEKKGGGMPDMGGMGGMDGMGDMM